MIAGAPLGAQIFLDDQWEASTDSHGEAKLSTLAPGPHRLRLALNGYLDYEQDVQPQTGQVSTITAKLEPLEPAILTTSAKPPSFPLSPVVPPPVRFREPPAPDFVPDRSLKGHSGWATGVAFSVDGQRLASGSWDQKVKFWNVLTGNQLSTIASKMKGVQIIVSKAGIVYVVGDLRQPTGVVMESSGLTVLKAIALAQGTNHTASLNNAKTENNAKLIRNTPAGRREIPIPLNKILSNKAEDLQLQPEDILFVPSSAVKSATRRGLEAILQTATGVAIYSRY